MCFYCQEINNQCGCEEKMKRAEESMKRLKDEMKLLKVRFNRVEKIVLDEFPKYKPDNV
jgi:hypothetical protein